MPAELFVDTSAWFTLAVRGESGHDRMARLLRARVAGGDRVVTTNLVIAECHVLLHRRAGREVALRFLRQVGVPPNVVVWSTPDLEAAAVRDWLEPFEDQDFSFTDGVSFAVMKARGIREALALDQHFAAAGFALPR